MISNKRSYMKEIDGLVGLINSNYQYSSNNYKYNSYIDPFYQNYQSMGYEDLGFNTPIDTRSSNFDTVQYLIDLGVNPQIATIFSGTFMLLVGGASGILLTLSPYLIAVCIIILSFCLIGILNDKNVDLKVIRQFIITTFANISVGLNYVNNLFSDILSSSTGSVSISINGKKYDSIPFSLIDVAIYLQSRQFGKYYIITSDIDSNIDYWYIIPKAFDYNFIVTSQIYNYGFSTYTKEDADADAAIFYGTPIATETTHHSYSANSTKKLAACHYHAVVGGIVKAPHSFYGNFYGSALIQQPYMLNTFTKNTLNIY